MGVSAIEADGRHRRKRADARRRWKGGAPGMLAARVAEVRLRVVWDCGNRRTNNDFEDQRRTESLVTRTYIANMLQQVRFPLEVFGRS